MKCAPLVFTCVVLGILVHPAISANDGNMDSSTPDRKEEVPTPLRFSGEARVGYSTQSGNTTTDSFSASVAASATKGQNTLVLAFRAFQSASSGKRIAESYRASLTDELRLGSSSHGLYAKVSWLRDTFSGVEHRIKPGIGYVTAWIEQKETKTSLKTRLGVQHRHTEEVSGATNNETVLQASFLVNWPLRQDFLSLKAAADFGGNVEDLSDYEFEGLLGLTSAISKWFDFYTDYVIYYSSIPVPGFRKTDTKLTAGLGVKF